VLKWTVRKEFVRAWSHLAQDKCSVDNSCEHDNENALPQRGTNLLTILTIASFLIRTLIQKVFQRVFRKMSTVMDANKYRLRMSQWPLLAQTTATH
jgi:hypothetical protein